jgi:O-acetylserine/cysteine efflux transporter
VKLADVFIAILVAVIWGFGFIASRFALNEFSPELMTALRFSVAAVPCLFLSKPAVSWPILIAISSTLFFGQFLAQAFGISHGVPVGLSSVIVQSQALFTIALAAVIFREVPTPMQGVGIAISTVGLLMICGTVGYDFSVAAFAMIMISPICFAAGNLLLRKASGAPMYDLFAWLSLTAAVPLMLLSLVSNGPASTWHELTHASAKAIISILFIGCVTTSIAYWLWGRLLRDHPAAQVVPFALLVPFVGSAASSVVFGETFGPLRLAGMITVIGGIAVMLFFGRARAPKASEAEILPKTA